METMVTTNCGKVMGFQQGGAVHFYGIPYAEPPVGKRRFMPPAAKKPWSGTLQCTAYGNICWQNPSPLSRNTVGSSEIMHEDCLYLNISCPAAPDTDKCPVLFWVHGGAFQVGSGRVGFNPELYTSRGIIAVSANYRLGMLGFLQTDEYLGSSYRESGNCGMLDLIAALSWIKENIPVFGGDPENIVVIGQSAGAKLISSILLTKSGRALISKAILESGATQCIRDIATAREVARRYFEKSGLEKAHAADLLTWPAKRIIAGQKVLFQGINLHTVGPVFDGINIVGDSALSIIQQSGAFHIPVLCGTNRDEASLFYHNASRLQYLNTQNAGLLFGNLSEAMMHSYHKRCPHETEAEVVRWLTEALYRNGVLQFVRAMHRANTAPVYLYRFDWDKLPIKAAHGVECCFVWNEPAKFPGIDSLDGYDALAAKIVDCWTAFIKTGNPQTNALPPWPPYTEESGEMMLLDSQTRVVPVPGGFSELKDIHQIYAL